MSEQPNVPLVSYVSPELLAKVQCEAKRSNRSVAGQVRDILERTFSTQPKVERR